MASNVRKHTTHHVRPEQFHPGLEPGHLQPCSVPATSTGWSRPTGRFFIVCTISAQAIYCLSEQYISMPYRPPLSMPQLKDITARTAGDEDARALLWEIRRLQDKLVSIYGFLPDDRQLFPAEVRYVRRLLATEPCLEEKTKGVRSLF